MADNTTLNSGTGGDTISTDELTSLNGGAVSGVKVQRVKVGFGSDAALRDVDASNGLPVAQQGTWVLGANSGVDIGDVSINNSGGASAVPIQDGGNSITVDATSLPLPTGAATAANQSTANTSLATLAGAVSGTEMQVDVLTMPTTTVQATNLDIRDLAATSDTVTAKLATDALQNGTTALTPKFAAIAASTSGDNEIVAAVVSKKIRVLSYVLVASAAVNAKWQSATAGDISGLLYCAANGGVAAPYAPTGHFETTAGEALQLNLSAATAVGGHVTYVEV